MKIVFLGLYILGVLFALFLLIRPVLSAKGTLLSHLPSYFLSLILSLGSWVIVIWYALEHKL
jgi:hypothetical protein